MKQLLDKIGDRSARVVVVGIGYVGLPLVVEFARAGYEVVGYDKDLDKVRLLGLGESYIGDIPSATLKPLVDKGLLRASTDPDVLGSADAIVVCVPTPLNKTKDPDMRFIASASDEIADHQHPGMVVILESTTYPGTTREVLVPKLTRGRYELGKDVFVAFSPERVDPGNKTFFVKNTPKVLGGATPACLEVALMSRRLGIDVWEVIRAAATKPFGFMPFFPGPGLGGHCIPIDPLYLSWRMRTLKYQARFIELADSINSSMPEYVVTLTQHALNDAAKAAKGSKVLVVGVAYKKDVSDFRESPAFDILHGLSSLGASVSYLDPHVPEVDENGIVMRSVAPNVSFADYDAVVLVTNHSDLDYERMLREAKIVVDTRDALRDVPGDKSRVVRL